VARGTDQRDSCPGRAVSERGPRAAFALAAESELRRVVKLDTEFFNFPFRHVEARDQCWKKWMRAVWSHCAPAPRIRGPIQASHADSAEGRKEEFHRIDRGQIDTLDSLLA